MLAPFRVQLLTFIKITLNTFLDIPSPWSSLVLILDLVEGCSFSVIDLLITLTSYTSHPELLCAFFQVIFALDRMGFEPWSLTTLNSKAPALPLSLLDMLLYCSF